MKTIVFAGGGTAGHVMPNLALISELKNSYNCVYVGGDGMERELCAARGIPFHTIRTVKLRRDKPLTAFAVPFALARCVGDAKKILREIKPDLVFSKGGYAALPVVLAAKKIPVIIHESDYSPGLTTKLSKHRSDRILCAFSDCADKIKRAEHCGTPLARALYAGHADKAAYGLIGNKPVLAVVGGSSGAATLNALVGSALPRLLKQFDVIHVTGKNKLGGKPQPGYCPIEFENNMPRLYATSDIMITRAGANALCECIALKIPTIAVPLEKASRGDQLQNAEYFSRHGAVTVLHERDTTSAMLCDTVLRVYNNKSRYAAAMSELGVDGTKRICDIITDTLARPTGRS